MKLILEAETTEYNVRPRQDNETTLFHLHEESLAIHLLDPQKYALEKTEISSSDAIKLAKLILHYYAIQD